MNARMMAVAALAAFLLAVGGAMAGITIKTARVGDPGNAADTRYVTPGYGSVGYAYNIGKYELTAGQYTAFLNAVGGVDTYALYNTEMWSSDYLCDYMIQRSESSGIYTYSVAADFTNRPVSCVSWGDAVRFANWMTNGQPTGAQGPLTTEDGAYHLDGAITDAALMAVVVPSAAQRATWSNGAKPYFLLTSEDEWYKAAYYKGGTNAGYWDYPTSSNTVPGQDMTEATNPGNNANFYIAPYTFPIDSGKYTTIAGQFWLSDSPYGTFDQGGNVWEWNEAILSGSSRGLRGGSFGSGGEIGASYRFDDSPSFELYSLGFRVSVVPEPGSAALVIFVGLALFRRFRRR
jgi:formylglycine-generating enzyme